MVIVKFNVLVMMGVVWHISKDLFADVTSAMLIMLLHLELQ